MLSIRQLILRALAVSVLFCIGAATGPSVLAQSSASEVQVTVPASPASVSGALGTRSPFLGSVPTGTLSGAVLPLSLSDALDRGLKYNLGLIESDVRTRAARAERLRNLSELLPNISASVSQSAEQVNLAALGVKIPLAGFPVIVGPFGVEDARAYWSQKLFDWNAVEKLRASQNN